MTTFSHQIRLVRGALSLQITHADVSLPKVIDSKMVLQRDKEVPVWGWADEGEEVRELDGPEPVDAEGVAARRPVATRVAAEQRSALSVPLLPSSMPLFP